MVPAAGRGSRLGADVPKVFVEILPGLTIWDAVRRHLAPVVDHLVLVLSPGGREFVATHRDRLRPDAFDRTSLGQQAEPRGMGDAIFGVADLWGGYDDIVVVWGDQFNVSPATYRGALAVHAALPRPALALPVVRAPRPYVEYVFDRGGRLTAVRQSREGDTCAAQGFSDTGVFILSAGAPLLAAWRDYLATNPRGAATGEVNFLPFLVHLSLAAGWPVGRHEISDPGEAVGINTPEELAFARALLQRPAAHG
ncbi:MAG TPA: NTP transferase domain-containing protein [Lacunisphaera sp.]|nr:NTP transferase domain-containing protein [Lacunisphaera sp.]